MKKGFKIISTVLVLVLMGCFLPVQSAKAAENQNVYNRFTNYSTTIDAPKTLNFIYNDLYDGYMDFTINIKHHSYGIGELYDVVGTTGRTNEELYSSTLAFINFGDEGQSSFHINVKKPGTHQITTELYVRGGDTSSLVFTITANPAPITVSSDGVVVPATCKTTGLKNSDYSGQTIYKWGDEYYSDEACDDGNKITLETIAIIPDAHNWGEWTDNTPGNCVEKGTQKRVCANDPSHVDTRETDIAPDKHKSELIDVEEKAPTISDYGVKAHWECPDCHTKYLNKDDEEPASDEALRIDKLAYSFKASEYKWSKGSNSGCPLTADNNYSGIEADEKFDSLYIDGRFVANTNYSLDKGSVIITLKPSYLNTLKNGKHTVKAVFSDGGEAETVLRVVNESTDSPSTGDNTMLMPVWVILILSMMSAAYFFIKGHYAKLKAFISNPSSDN